MLRGPKWGGRGGRADLGGRRLLGTKPSPARPAGPCWGRGRCCRGGPRGGARPPGCSGGGGRGGGGAVGRAGGLGWGWFGWGGGGGGVRLPAVFLMEWGGRVDFWGWNLLPGGVGGGLWGGVVAPAAVARL